MDSTHGSHGTPPGDTYASKLSRLDITLLEDEARRTPGFALAAIRPLDEK
jgi:hypothetical protein